MQESVAWTEHQSQDSRVWAERADFVTKALRAAHMGEFGASDDSETEAEAEGAGAGAEQHGS